MHRLKGIVVSESSLGRIIARAVFLLSIFLFLLPIGLDALAPDYKIDINQLNLRPWGGYAWAVEIALPLRIYEVDSDHGGVVEASPRFTEDGTIMGPPHSSHDQVRRQGQGCFSLWNGLFVFSSGDGTDPRDNGRHYQLTGHARLVPRVADMLLLSAALASILSLAVSVGFARIPLNRGGMRLKYDQASLLPAALPPLLLSVVLMLFAPPVLSSIDSAVFMTESTDLIPLYGPIYMILIKAVETLFSDGRTQIITLQIIQHICTILGTTVFATAFKTPWRIAFASIFLSIGTGFGFFEHGITADALAIGEAAALLGISFRIARDGFSRGRIAAFCAGEIMLGLTRYHFMVFAAILPIYFSLCFIVAQKPFAARMRDTALSYMTFTVALAAMFILLWNSCLCLGTHPSLFPGRQGTHRIAEAARMVPDAKRAMWIASLQARTDDPAVRIAMATMATGPVAWFPAWQSLERDPALWGRDVDTVEDTAFHVFAFALDDPVVLAQWRREIAVFGGSNSGFWWDALSETDDAATAVRTPQSRQTYPWLNSAIRAEDAPRWHAIVTAIQPSLSFVGRYFAFRLPAILTIAMIAVALVRRGNDTRDALCAAALLGTLLLSVLGISFSNIIQVRHLLPGSMLTYAAASVITLRPIARSSLHRAQITQRN